jgi:hypothetical protein
MHPLFLPPAPGAAGGPRFAVLHRPPGTPRGLVVFVHPFAEEMNKARRMAALQARALAGHGWAVLMSDLLDHDTHELHQHLTTHRDALPILAQQSVHGGDECIYFVALKLDHGRVLRSMPGREIASHPLARGQTAIAETVDAPEVQALTEQFFAGVQLSGPISLELKRDALGRYWFIEAMVGRTDLWAELFMGAGFIQPLIEWQLACGLPATTAGPMRHCLWCDTERDPLAWLRLCWQRRTRRPRRVRNLFPHHGDGDWRPVLRALRRMDSRLSAAAVRRLDSSPANDRNYSKTNRWGEPR